MWSRNHRAITVAERRHIDRVKILPCSVCDESVPSEAHHIEQQNHWCVVAVCVSCHRNEVLGLHGQKRMWAIKKMSELDALSVTLKRLLAPPEPHTRELLP